jgi:uncharacterized repeat protein (TIGR01451 family)/LPXTG-motif cell wall-anchored protein
VSTVTARADLAIEKSLAAPLQAGQQGTYDLAVTNAGPSTAAEVVVTDTLPDGIGFVSASGEGWSCSDEGQVVTCDRTSLAEGESSTISIVVDVADSLAGDTVTNVADVSSSIEDPDKTNNHDELETQVPLVEPTQIESTTTTTQAQQVISEGTLPRTGTDPNEAVTVALLLVGAGTVLMLVRRRAAHHR